MAFPGEGEDEGGGFHPRPGHAIQGVRLAEVQGSSEEDTDHGGGGATSDGGAGQVTMEDAGGLVIDEVEMHGFMRYVGGKQNIIFPSGFTVITGKTGAGKQGQ